ncbi:hypothetical protein X798_02284, partial [Onchocerca flexuosa]
FSSKADFLTEFGDNFDDRSIELAEKNSNESSPSPSDSSNNVDEISYTAADLEASIYTHWITTPLLSILWQKGTDITSALSSDDFLLRLGADKPTIKLDNEQEEESEIFLKKKNEKNEKKRRFV